MARGTRCEAHAHEYATAEERHHLRPKSRGGTDAPDNMLMLCANAHGDVHYFLDLIELYARVALTETSPGRRSQLTAKSTANLVPGPIAVRYGPRVRRYAREGWMRYGDEFLAGVWRRHAGLWLTSGEPVDVDPIAPSVPPFRVALARVEVPYWLSLAGLALAAHRRGEVPCQPAPPPRSTLAVDVMP